MSAAHPPVAPKARGPQSAAVWIAATRPQFLTVTAVAVLVGLSTAKAGGTAIAWGPTILTMIAALVVHGAANVVNDYHDRFADENNVERLTPFTGGSRIIQDRRLSARAMLFYGYGLMGVTLVLGALLASAGRPQLWTVGGIGLLLAWAYSAPPLRISARGLGEFVIAAAWLLVVVGSDVVQRGEWSYAPFAAGLPIALLVAAILQANEFPDRAADLAAGKGTIVVRLGPKIAAWVYLVLVLHAYLWVPAMVYAQWLPALSLVSLLSAPLSLSAAATLIEYGGKPPTARVRPALKSTILAAHLHGLLMAGAVFYAAPG